MLDFEPVGDSADRLRMRLGWLHTFASGAPER